MKIIRIQGGLGNQMFQYANGRNIELSGKKIIFDISFYNGNKAKIDTVRDFKLDKFNIKTNAEFSKIRHTYLDFTKKILAKIGIIGYGFFQSEKYFKDIENIIRNEFTLKSPLSTQSRKAFDLIKSSKNPISLHIRRGDYVNDAKTNKNHGTCNPEYYYKALEYITSRIGKDINIIVFSDDISWVKENMSFPYPTTYVSSPEIPDYEELILMSKCKHNIIANSSFSWWGAWLNENRDKIVIAPSRWVLKNEKNFKDIIPESWIKI